MATADEVSADAKTIIDVVQSLGSPADGMAAFCLAGAVLCKSLDKMGPPKPGSARDLLVKQLDAYLALYSQPADENKSGKPRDNLTAAEIADIERD